MTDAVVRLTAASNARRPLHSVREGARRPRPVGYCRLHPR